MSLQPSIPVPVASGSRVAVVGSGAAGLAAALMLAPRCEVHLFEAAPRLGGHCNTVRVSDPMGPVDVDTGFIVFNPVNYPTLCRAFDHLGVASRPSVMTFSVSAGRGAFEYAGNFPGGIAAQPANFLRRRWWAMLADIGRFYRLAIKDVAALERSGETLGSYLARKGFSIPFRDDHLAPMAAAIWSQPQGTVADMPAATLIRFFAAHGLLRLRDRPRWRTVEGGSQAYVRRIVGQLGRHGARIHAAAPVVELTRGPSGVRLGAESGYQFDADHVVLAVHADQALAILGAGAQDRERSILGEFGYRQNRAVLHRDVGLMPRRRRAWASWNYIVPEGPSGPQGVTYWMNLLQGFETARPVFVSLNPPFEADPSLTEATFDYAHPVFDRAAVAAQAGLPGLQGANRTWFCGSYFGYGFHEDAFASGVRVACSMGAEVPWERPAATLQAAE